jgi:hypothetical protein
LIYCWCLWLCYNIVSYIVIKAAICTLRFCYSVRATFSVTTTIYTSILVTYMIDFGHRWVRKQKILYRLMCIQVEVLHSGWNKKNPLHMIIPKSMRSVESSTSWFGKWIMSLYWKLEMKFWFVMFFSNCVWFKRSWTFLFDWKLFFD